MRRALRPAHAGREILYRIRTCRNVAAGSCPVGVEELPARLVDALVGMGAEIVALGLEQVRREPRGAVAVVEGERRGEGRHGDAAAHRGGNNAPPGGFALREYLAEVVVEHQIRQLLVAGKGVLDAAQEHAADNAAAPPH